VVPENPVPRIDECGFESRSFECEKCGATLAGVIDPFDETLLLSEIVCPARTATIAAPRVASSKREFFDVPPSKVA
jgi:hypothetical protein